MQHEVPLDDSSMSRWRTRVGAQRLAAMLEETVAIAVRDKHVSENELKQVNVDTTVQEKPPMRLSWSCRSPPEKFPPWPQP